jgi:hypothetical protein
MTMKAFHLARLAVAALILPASIACADGPANLAVPGETLVSTLHAQGAQVYECKADATGKLTWQFREPVATLIKDGKTVGRHYAGPHWELADGSTIAAKVAARADGANPSDIPLLKLEVTTRRGKGELDAITTVLRINTKGGVAAGACESAGVFLSVPYVADYALYAKAR